MQTKEMFEAQLDVSLGGRVAEELIFGSQRVTEGNDNITTGCGSDLRHSTKIAYGLARSLAMRDSIMISMEKRDLSDGMNYQVDLEAQRIIQVGSPGVVCAHHASLVPKQGPTPQALARSSRKGNSFGGAGQASARIKLIL